MYARMDLSKFAREQCVVPEQQVMDILLANGCFVYRILVFILDVCFDSVIHVPYRLLCLGFVILLLFIF
jgi:hypothetical protein